jgi:hypothetical protein
LRKTEANFNDKSVKESGNVITDKSQVPKLSDEKVVSHNNQQNLIKPTIKGNDSKLPAKKKKKKKKKKSQGNIESNTQKTNSNGLSVNDWKILNMSKHGSRNSGYVHGLSDW